MSAGLLFEVTFEELEAPTFGLWCNRCALPSGASLSMALTGAGPMGVMTITRCVECGNTLDEEEDVP